MPLVRRCLAITLVVGLAGFLSACACRGVDGFDYVDVRFNSALLDGLLAEGVNRITLCVEESCAELGGFQRSDGATIALELTEEGTFPAEVELWAGEDTLVETASGEVTLSRYTPEGYCVAVEGFDTWLRGEVAVEGERGSLELVDLGT